jgi:hypothetical protein
MRAAVTCSFVVLFLCGCDATAPPPAANKQFDPEYFRKMEVCEKQPDPITPIPSTFDYGARLIDPKRPARWDAQHTYLGDTCFKAAIGAFYYMDGSGDKPVAYSIDVEARKTDTAGDGQNRSSSVVLFEREFEINELPNGFEKEMIANVVRFDERTRVVRFSLGQHSYEYLLPRP